MVRGDQVWKQLSASELRELRQEQRRLSAVPHLARRQTAQLRKILQILAAVANCRAQAAPLPTVPSTATPNVSPVDPTPTPTFTPTATPTATPFLGSLRQTCSDGIDNDGDGLSDMQDPDCFLVNQSESPVLSPSQIGLGLPRDLAGFTHFASSPDTQIIYVSASEGSDTNDGLSPQRPIRGFRRAHDLVRQGYPDWVLLKRGDVFENALSFGNEYGGLSKAGRSASEPLVIGSYGNSPERPTIRTVPGGVFIQGSNSDVELGNLAVVGLHFDGSSQPWYKAPTPLYFLEGLNVLLEDNLIEKFGGAFAFQEYSGPISNIHIHRNVIVDQFSRTGSHSQGFYTSNVNGLIVEENIFDKNGCSARTVEANLTNASWDPSARTLSQSGAFGAGSYYPIWHAGDMIKVTAGTLGAGTIASFVPQGEESNIIRGSNELSPVDDIYLHHRLRVRRADGSWTAPAFIEHYNGSLREFTLAQSFRLQETIGGVVTDVVRLNAEIDVQAYRVEEVAEIVSPNAIRLTSSSLWGEPLTGIQTATGEDGRCTMFNRHAYISGGTGTRTNTIVAGNISRSGASGFAQMRQGGAALGNVSMWEPAHISFGHEQNVDGSVYTGVIRGNLAIGGQDINSRAPLGWGYLVGAGRRQSGVWGCYHRSENVSIENNLLLGTSRSTSNVMALSLGRCLTGVTIAHNTVYNWVRNDSSGAGAAFVGSPWNHSIDSVLFAENDFQQPLGTRALDLNAGASDIGPGNLFFASNRYFTGLSGGAPFFAFGRNMSVFDWMNASEWLGINPENERVEQVQYSGSSRRVESYLESIGYAPSEDEFWSRLRHQSRADWDPELQAHRVNNFIRVGFDKAGLPDAATMIRDVLQGR